MSVGTGISAVIFDYGEVLCHRPPDEDFHRLAKVFGADANSFRALWEKNRGAFDRGDTTAEDYWMGLAEDAGTAIDREQLDQVCKWDIEMFGRANLDMVRWLGQLRQGGIKTGLLSNIHFAMIAYLRENFDWLELFDFKTFSAEVRLIKPDPLIYEHCLRGLDIAPSEALFIDDRQVNIEAARNMGIHGIQFKSMAQLKMELEATGFPMLPEDPVQTKAVSI